MTDTADLVKELRNQIDAHQSNIEFFEKEAARCEAAKDYTEMHRLRNRAEGELWHKQRYEKAATELTRLSTENATLQARVGELAKYCSAAAHSVSASLGVPSYFKCETDFGQFRCANCSMMQPRGSVLVWVPDGLRQSDPEWAAREAARQNAYNGHVSGWCKECVRQWVPQAPEGPKRKPLLARLLTSLSGPTHDR